MTMGMNEMIKDAVGRYQKGSGDLGGIPAMFDAVIGFAKDARYYGLLALEEGVAKLAKEKCGVEIDTRDSYFYGKLSGTDRLLAVLVMSVVDAMDPELLEQIAIERYYASDYQGSEAIAACMAIIGVLSIQEGENPHVIAQKLLALLPEQAENEMLERILEQNQEEDSDGQIPDDFFADRGEEPSEIVRALNGVLGIFNSAEMQCILQQTDSEVLCLCLKAMGGSARKTVFDNVSPRLAGTLYEGVESCAATQEEMESAAAGMLEIILALEDIGEVVLKGTPYEVATLEKLIAPYAG